MMGSGYLIYIGLFLSGGVAPNATSWCLWALGGAIEAWSYRKVIRSSSDSSSGTKGRSRKKARWSEVEPLEMTSWVCAIFAVIIAAIGVIFGFLAQYGITSLVSAFAWPEDWELWIAGGDILVVLTYMGMRRWTGESRAARTANALMMVDIFLSFIPIWYSTWHTPSGEHVLPWIVWTTSYAILGAAGAIQIGRSRGDRRWLMMYPLLSAIFHGLVGVLALR